MIAAASPPAAASGPYTTPGRGANPNTAGSTTLPSRIKTPGNRRSGANPTGSHRCRGLVATAGARTGGSNPPIVWQPFILPRWNYKTIIVVGEAAGETAGACSGFGLALVMVIAG